MHEESLVGVLFAGRYHIESIIGSGGMGTVYRATHRVLRRAVAIKLLHRGMLQVEGSLARFEREARAASKVEHKRLARIWDFGQTEAGIPYLVMELAEGAPLSQLLTMHGLLPVPRVVRILDQVAEGLAAAHAVGVVHRDLKPDNVILNREQGQDQIKLLDFGLAKIISATVSGFASAPGVFAGSPTYVSPEQVADMEIDERTDLYSLGVLAFEMLSGEPPFTGRLMEVIAAHVHLAPPALDGLHRQDELPDGLISLVARCLAKAPEDRPDSAREVRQVLSEFIP